MRSTEGLTLACVLFALLACGQPTINDDDRQSLVKLCDEGVGERDLVEDARVLNAMTGDSKGRVVGICVKIREDRTLNYYKVATTTSRSETLVREEICDALRPVAPDARITVYCRERNQCSTVCRR